jgi:hypothetical protein
VLAVSPSHDALGMRQQWTFRVMNLRHHHNHHHHCDNGKTTQRHVGLLLQAIAVKT